LAVFQGETGRSAHPTSVFLNLPLAVTPNDCVRVSDDLPAFSPTPMALWLSLETLRFKPREV